MNLVSISVQRVMLFRCLGYSYVCVGGQLSDWTSTSFFFTGVSACACTKLPSSCYNNKIIPVRVVCTQDCMVALLLAPMV